MDRIWLKQYPAGVPADIDVNQYPSLVELLEESFKKFADRKSFICMDKAITYGELDEMSAAIGAYLQSKGLKKGSRVAIMMPNVLQNPVASSAILRAGFTVVNVNPLYTPRELEHQLKDSGAEAILLLENFATTLQKGGSEGGKLREAVRECSWSHLNRIRAAFCVPCPLSILRRKARQV